MKTFPVLLATAAAPVAFALVPFSFEITVSLLFVAGLTLIVVSDYGHGFHPHRAAATKVGAAPRSERFGLAA